MESRKDPLYHWKNLLHPAFGLLASLLAAFVFALVIRLRYEGDTEWFFLYYHVPISIPFVGFLFDRARGYLQKMPGQLISVGLDTVIIALALTRSVYPVPYISGHALFLSYALVTARTWWVRIPVLAVLLEVIYLKVFCWHDPTLFGGCALGCAAGFLWIFLWRKLQRMVKIDQILE